MYCKTCGAENPPSSIYCTTDGALLRNQTSRFKKNASNSAFCSNCGDKKISNDNYCMECGNTHFQYSTEKGLVPKLTTDKIAGIQFRQNPLSLNWLNLQYIKNAIIPVIIAILVIFGLSFSVMKSSENLLNSMLSEQMDNNGMNSVLTQIETKAGTSLPKSFFGISDIVMMSNLQNLSMTFDIKGTVDGEDGKIHADAKAKNVFLIYILIPLIGLFAGGIFAGRKNRITQPEKVFSHAAWIAIIYTLFMSIFSLFAGYSFHTNVNVGGTSLLIDFKANYSFIKTLLMTLLFGFSFSCLGILFSITFRKATGHLADWYPSGEAIRLAIVIPFSGIALFTFSLFIYFSSKLSDFKHEFSSYLLNTPLEKLLDHSYVLIASLSVQLGSYIWNLLHLSPLQLLIDMRDMKGSLTYNPFSGFKITGDSSLNTFSLNSSLFTTDIEMYLKLAIFIPIALFIFAGFRIGKKPNLLKNLIIFSAVYAVIMCVLTAITNLGFTLNAQITGQTPVNMSMDLGYGNAGTFIRSLLLSFVFAYLGTWINKLKTNG